MNPKNNRPSLRFTRDPTTGRLVIRPFPDEQRYMGSRKHVNVQYQQRTIIFAKLTLDTFSPWSPLITTMLSSSKQALTDGVVTPPPNCFQLTPIYKPDKGTGARRKNIDTNTVHFRSALSRLTLRKQTYTRTAATPSWFHIKPQPSTIGSAAEN